MKILTKSSGFVHYYAQCSICGWTAGIHTDATPNHNDVRKASRQHVAATGHTVVLSAGKETVYEVGKEEK